MKMKENYSRANGKRLTGLDINLLKFTINQNGKENRKINQQMDEQCRRNKNCVAACCKST